MACNSDGPRTPPSEDSAGIRTVAPSAATDLKDGQAKINAKPNPVPAGPGNGWTTLTWNSKLEAGFARLYVSENGAAEKLVAQGQDGTLDIPWIQTGNNYEFRIYSETESNRQLIDKVVVTRAN